MTPIMLQKELKKELEELFAGFSSSEDAKFKERSVSVYEQDLPLEMETEDEEGKTPFIIVRLSEGELEQRENAEMVTVVIIFCARDTAWNRSGYQDVLNMIQKVKERLLKNPLVGKYFTAELPLKWVVQEGETHDIYYGGMELTFACPAIQRESKFA